MKLKNISKIAAALGFAVAMGCTLNVATAAPTAATDKAAASNQTVSLLDGKQVFKLQGYQPQPVPGGAPGTMYHSKAEKRVLIVNEDEKPLIARAASDADFLEGMKSIKDKQKESSPSYTVLSEKTEHVKGLDVYHVEATSNMGGNDVQQATLIAVAGKKFSVIQVISNHRDKAGHIAAVNNILGK